MAQLNSASDYGSEGYRFESCRGHIKQETVLKECGFSFFGKAELAQGFGLKWKTSSVGCAVSYLQERNKRKTPRSAVILSRSRMNGSIRKNAKLAWAFFCLDYSKSGALRDASAPPGSSLSKVYQTFDGQSAPCRGHFKREVHSI